MKMCGATKLEDLHPGYLNTLAAEQVVPSGAYSLLEHRTRSRL